MYNEDKKGMITMNIIRREHLDRLIAFKDKQLIKVVTGIRRCGKSTLFEIYQDYLISNNVTPDQIISINFEDYDYEELLEPKHLYEYIKSKIIIDKKVYVFLDEVQNVKDFHKVVDSLFIKKNIDLYITGSNAYMLSSNIATLISGRYVEIKMLPLSFKEYVLSTGNENELQRKYREYIEFSSFPYVLELNKNKKIIGDYLDGLLNTIILKDVVQRHKIADILMFKSILRFLFDNIGNQLSSKKIADTLTSNGRKIDSKTVEKYINALIESYVIYQAKRYNIKGKEYLKTLEKYYVVDIGLRYALLGSSPYDTGHILENVIYLELIRRGYEVYVGKINDLEVDFVAMKENKIIYFQVAATTRDNQTLARELASLEKISDHYQKFILTLDDDPETNYNGIRKINVLDWLLGKIQ